MKLGTTGTRNIPQAWESEYVERLTAPDMLEWLSQFDGFVTGACIGWDDVFGTTMALTFPEKEHLVIVPADRSRVVEWWHAMPYNNISVMEMPEGTTYRDRNMQIIENCDHLFYCAEYSEDHPKSIRSGTWMTVRIARTVDMPVDGWIINEETE